jgi:hypothetical protein
MDSLIPAHLTTHVSVAPHAQRRIGSAKRRMTLFAPSLEIGMRSDVRYPADRDMFGTERAWTE